MPSKSVRKTPGLVPLSPRLRIALDALRAIAALYVVAHHITVTRQTRGVLRVLFGFGQEAVIVFFLLSGFVIFANERDRCRDLGAYLVRRVRRIAPTLLAACAIAAVIAALDHRMSSDFSPRSLAGTLAFVSDISSLKPGVWADPLYGNSPLWSLGYEMFFYLVFPVLMAVHRHSPLITAIGVGVASSIALTTYFVLPNHLSLVLGYLALWWMGAVLADFYQSARRARSVLIVGLLCLTATVAVAALFTARLGWRGPGVFPGLILRHLLVGLAFALMALGPVRAIADLCLRGQRLWLTLARPSYEIYAFHYPLVASWRFAHSPAGLAVAVVLLGVLAWGWNWVLDHLIPKAPRTIAE